MISTFKVLGDIFNCRFLHIVHVIFTIAILLVWCCLMAATVTAFCRGKIFKSPTEDVLSDTKFPPITTKKHQKSRRAAERFGMCVLV